MTTINYLSISRNGPSELSDWTIEANSWVHQSPYTKSVDTLSMPGAMWGFTAVYKNLGLADRAIAAAWFTKLAGIGGRFYFSHPKYSVPRGTARGTGTCSAASQFASSLTLNGLTNGTTLLAGDFVQVGTDLLVMVTDDATVSAGAITVNVGPMLRIAVGAGTAFTLVSPRGQFRLVEDKQGLNIIPGPSGGFGDLTIRAVEAF